jgi:hypothetical protein
VGSPSTNKRPALDAALDLLGRDFNETLRQHEEQKLAARAVRDAWEKEVAAAANAGKPPPPMPLGAEEPLAPVCPRLKAGDTTTEALAYILAQWPRGLLWQRDELTGLLGNLDR